MSDSFDYRPYPSNWAFTKQLSASEKEQAKLTKNDYGDSKGTSLITQENNTQSTSVTIDNIAQRTPSEKIVDKGENS